MHHRPPRLRPPRALGCAWALPCTLLGLAIALPLLAAGGRLRRAGGHLELALHAGELPAGSRLHRWPFAALTLGHLVLGTSEGALRRLRTHEAAHVRQYERWGPLFLLAYPAAGLWAGLRGRHPYLDNRFERQARAAAERAHEPGNPG